MCEKEDIEMTAETMARPISKERKENIVKALKEVGMIQMGKLPRKSGRDFLKESRSK